MRIISSQRFLDDKIVEKKRRQKDYTVQYISIEIDRVKYIVVIDGHHSMAAARLDSAQIVWEIPDHEAADFAHHFPWTFLELYQFDSPYYDVNTGQNIRAIRISKKA